jgi:O-antigen ligase
MGKKSREKKLRKKEEKKQINSENITNFSSGLEKVCFYIVKYGIYLSLFSPLIIVRSYFFPFVVPKTIFFRIIVCIIFIAYILLATANPKYRPRINFLTVFIALFIGILFLTSILGVDFSRSFWSVFERTEGLLTYFHLFAFYLVLTGFLKEKKDWQNVLLVSVSVAFIISLVVLFSTNQMTRGGGTIGNSSFFSAYVLFNLFFAFILLFSKKPAIQIFAGLALIFFLASLFFNPMGFTKGAVSSLGIGIGLLILGFMFFSKIKLLKTALPVVLILLAVLGIFIVQDFYFQDKEFSFRNIPDRARKIIWDMAWQGWQERLWLGWGLENFNVPFAKYHNPELPTTGDIWYDRVHNIVLDIGISSGMVGLLSYLSIFGAAIFGLTRFLPKAKDFKETIIPLTMIVLLLVYFLQNIWVFDMISTHIMFFLSLAFISFFITQKAKEEQREIKEKVIPIPAFLGSSLIVLAFFTLFFGNIQPARSAQLIVKGLASPLEQSIPAFEKALNCSTMAKFEGPEQLSLKVTSLLSQPDQDRDLLKQGFELVEIEYKQNIERNPLSFRSNLFLGRHYNYFYHFSGDKKALILAEGFLEKALQLAPNNQQVYFIFAQTKFLQEKPEEAIVLLQKAKELEPRFIEANWFLLRGYKLAGDYEKAFLELKELEKLNINWQDSPEKLKEGLEIFKKVEQDVNLLIPLYEKGVEFNPKDLHLWEDLINAYLEIGQIDKAKQLVQVFLEFNPEYKNEADQFLKNLEEISLP